MRFLNRIDLLLAFWCREVRYRGNAGLCTNFDPHPSFFDLVRIDCDPYYHRLHAGDGGYYVAEMRSPRIVSARWLDCIVRDARGRSDN
jgi:hypothetical protein